MTTQTYQRATITIGGESFEAIDLGLMPAPKYTPTSFAHPPCRCCVNFVTPVIPRELRRSVRRLKWTVDQFRRAARNDKLASARMAKRRPTRLDREMVAKLLPGTGYRVADRFPRGKRQNLKNGSPLLKQLEGVIET